MTAKLYLSIGLALAIFTMVLMPIAIFVPQMVTEKFENTILKSILITPEAAADKDNKVFPAWKNSTAENATPSTLHAYFFNVTNTLGVLDGEKPKLEEVGPYVYTISKQKDKIEFKIDTFGEKIVEYIEWKEYIFEPTQSIRKLPNGETQQLSEADVFVSNNILFQLWRSLGWIFEGELVKRFGGADWTDESRMFMSRNVKQWLFGWVDENYPQDEKYFPGLIGKPIHGADEVTEEPHAMYTGETRLGNAFQYYQRNGVKGYVPGLKTTNPMWTTYDASRLAGSDGTRFSPFLNETRPLQIYVEEAKRSLPMHFTHKSDLHGLELYNYHITKESMQSAYDNPANEQWSMYKTGIFNLTQQKVMPMILTKPHFLDCDAELQDGVEGLKPNRAIHDTLLGVHQITGIVMNATKSLQVSINTIGPYEVKSQSTTWFPKMLSNTYHPIGYMSEKGKIKDDDAKALNSKIQYAKVLKGVLSTGLLLLCIILLSATALLLYFAYKTKVASITTFNSGAYGDYQYNTVQ